MDKIRIRLTFLIPKKPGKSRVRFIIKLLILVIFSLENSVSVSLNREEKVIEVWEFRSVFMKPFRSFRTGQQLRFRKFEGDIGQDRN